MEKENITQLIKYRIDLTDRVLSLPKDEELKASNIHMEISKIDDLLKDLSPHSALIVN